MLHPSPSSRLFLVALSSDAFPPACLAIREQLQAYVDEELDAAPRAELVAHLVTCDRCTAAETGLRRCVERVRRAAGHEVPAPRALRVRATELLRRLGDDHGTPPGHHPSAD